jgi:integrase
MVQAYLDQRVRQGELSPKTANEYRVSLHSLVEFAIKYRGFISSDPQFPNTIKRVKRYQVSAEEITFLTLPQIDAQLKALEPWPQMRAVAATCIYAGLRRAEALWLTVDDVQLRRIPPLLQIRAKEIDGAFWEPKTKVNRVVPVSSALHPMLAQYSLARPKGSVWFFPSPHGCRWNEDNFTQAFAHVRRPTGLLWTLLDFRHTFGSQLAQKGESLYKISKLMGNSPEICRKHYAALVPEEMAEAVEFSRPNSSGKHVARLAISP